MTKTEQLIIAMGIDPHTGTSPWLDIDVLEQQVGFSLRGNGSPYLQNDRGVGKQYVIEKQYASSTAPRRAGRNGMLGLIVSN